MNFKYYLLDLIVCKSIYRENYGTFSGEGIIAGSTRVLSCITRYGVFGNGTYVCGLDGQWHGSGYCSKFNFFVLC